MHLAEIGSTWRKWDLQVHTPFSSLNNGFGSDWDTYVIALFKSAIENDIYAIGITDYFTIEGYKKLKEDYLGNSSKMKSLFSEDEIDKINKILILPNIEFRLEILVTDKNNKTSRVNFHVIFSEEVPIYQIEENFLHDLDFVKDGQPQNSDQKRKLKINNIIELGTTLKRQHPKFTESPLVVGMSNASVNSSQICEVLTKDIFKDKYILAVPCDEDLSRINWDSQGHNIRKVLIQKSDCLFTSNPKSIEWGLGLKSNDTQEYINEFKSIKPCIWGSDAHTYTELFKKNKDRFLWIKSDLCFDGLKQIIHEPKRVFIGDEPDSKRYVDLNPSLFIENLSISKISDLPSGEAWFENLNLKLNPGLVAIIGNKGSGKSAIADIIGLCGNTKNTNYFSFLTDKRFNMPPEKKSQFFEAEIIWRDKTKAKLNLSEKPHSFDNEKIKYLPQSFLEKLCLGETEKDLFENELRKIIFSRLPNEKKLGKNSLNEIINFKTEIYSQRIEQTKSELNLLNKKIIELEEQCQQEYIQKVNEEIYAANNKLKALNDKEPIEPDSSKNRNDVKTLSITSELEYNRDLLDNIDLLISTCERETEEISIELQEITNSIDFFKSLKSQITKSLASQVNFLDAYSINIDSVFTYKIDVSILEETYDERTKRLNHLRDLLEDFDPSHSSITNLDKITSLYELKHKTEIEIDILQAQLDLPTKEYQIYLSNQNSWQQEINSLVIDITGLEKRKEYLERELSHILASHYNYRAELVDTLFHYKLEIIKVYKELYQPVISFKENYQKELSSYKIDFDAKFVINQFVEKFESLINFGKSGSYYGKDYAIKKLNNLLNSFDLNNIDDLLNFQQAIIQSLLYDDKSSDKRIKTVTSQLKQHVRAEDLYEFIFNIDYLEPKFQLKLADKEISSLSPGERGALLLIFYLLLDNDKIPLVIDQPEENLDNQSIYSILVPFVQEAKTRRQVILITHNPNLAVVCDADQIVHVKINKNDKHTITCTTGSIENERINQLLIEVLEGTFPAFDTRNQRYTVTRSRMGYKFENDLQSS